MPWLMRRRCDGGGVRPRQRKTDERPRTPGLPPHSTPRPGPTACGGRRARAVGGAAHPHAPHMGQPRRQPRLWQLRKALAGWGQC